MTVTTNVTPLAEPAQLVADILAAVRRWSPDLPDAEVAAEVLDRRGWVRSTAVPRPRSGAAAALHALADELEQAQQDLPASARDGLDRAGYLARKRARDAERHARTALASATFDLDLDDNPILRCPLCEVVIVGALGTESLSWVVRQATDHHCPTGADHAQPGHKEA